MINMIIWYINIWSKSHHCKRWQSWEVLKPISKKSLAIFSWKLDIEKVQDVFYLNFEQLSFFLLIFLSLSAVADPALPSRIYQDIIEFWCHQIKTFHILYFRCFVFPWPALACPHEYQEIMEIRCHQIEIGRKCAQHFHSLTFLLGFLLSTPNIYFDSKESSCAVWTYPGMSLNLRPKEKEH